MKRPQTAALAVAVLVALIFGPGTYQLLRLHWMEYQLDRRLDRLSTRREHLLSTQERLASDPAYVEGLIRSTFKVARPDEVVVPLDDDPSLRDD